MGMLGCVNLSGFRFLVYYFLNTVFVLLSACIEWNECVVFLLCLEIVVGMKRIVSKSGSVISLASVFLFFSALYGLSAPISYLFGILNDGPTFPVYLYDSYLGVYLGFYSVAIFSYLLGTEIYTSTIDENIFEVKHESFVNDRRFLYVALLMCACFASVFEIINFLRVGGFSMLSMGKGVYQSEVGLLTLTMPADSFYPIFGMLVGVIVGKYGTEKTKTVLLFSFVLILPYLADKILMGHRGQLIQAVVVGTVFYTLFHPIKEISKKMFFWCAIIYLFMVFIVTNRGSIDIILNDTSAFYDVVFDFERYERYLNPIRAEFQCYTGNFLTFYSKYGMSFEWRWGIPYVEGIMRVLPRWLRIVDLPQSLVFDFRDEFFPDWAQRSEIAGTGFSLMLEGYMNFGTIGIMLVYFLIGFVLTYVYHEARKNLSIHRAILLCAISAIIVKYSRDALMWMWSSYFWTAIYVILVLSISQLLVKIFFRRKIDSDIDLVTNDN